MRIVTIVGIRGSGKTTVTEALIREFRRRGDTVGTVKTVFCPAFHMDKPGSNTDRHTQAGAALVTARAETETAVLYPEPLKPSEVFAHYTACDWVLCEGDYDIPVPRIVTAHQERDARERINGMTLAVSGIIANTEVQLDGLPVMHPERDIKALADLLESRTEDVQELSLLDQPLNGDDASLSRAFCAAGCKGHPRRSEGVRVTVNGAELTLTEEQKKEVLAWAKAR